MKGTDNTKRFAARLSELIDSSKEGAKGLADATHISDSAISKYRNDDGEAGINALVKIASYYNVTTDYLLGLTNDKNKNPSAVDELGLSEFTVECLMNEDGSNITGHNLNLPTFIDTFVENYWENNLGDYIDAAFRAELLIQSQENDPLPSSYELADRFPIELGRLNKYGGHIISAEDAKEFYYHCISTSIEFILGMQIEEEIAAIIKKRK